MGGCGGLDGKRSHLSRAKNEGSLHDGLGLRASQGEMGAWRVLLDLIPVAK